MFDNNNLDKILSRYSSLELKLAEGATGKEFIQLSKEFNDLEHIVEKIKAYYKVKEEIIMVVSNKFYCSLTVDFCLRRIGISRRMEQA